jgi:exonuclease SbcD
VDLIVNLREMLDETIAGSLMEILRIRNRKIMDRVIHSLHNEETLDDLNVNDVFERCLLAFDVPDEEKSELKNTYREIVRDLIEEDVHAE